MSSASRPAVSSVAIVCLILSVALYRLSETVADPDLWGHVRFGQDCLATGRIIHDDPYSYLTQGQRWINHEWLAEILFAGLFDLAGPVGLIGLKVAIALTIVGLCYRHLCRIGLSPGAGGIFLLPIILLLLPGLTIRPQLFTYLLFPLVLLAIDAAEQGRPRWLWCLPFVFLPWANLHGGFLAGLAVLLLWSSVHVVWQAWQKRSLAGAATVLLPVAASFLAILINPYGVQLPRFLLETATLPRPEITEWHPLKLRSLEGGLYLLTLAVAVAGQLGSRRPMPPALLLVMAGLAVGPVVSIRHLPLYAEAVAVLAGRPVADAWERWRGVDTPSPMSRLLTPLTFVAAAIVTILALPDLRCIRIDPAAGFSYPSRAIARIQASGTAGKLATYFDWGEYALWHLGPRVQVSIDGRRETVYSDEIRRENFDFIAGRGDWSRLLRRVRPDLVLVPRSRPVFALMLKEPGWRLVDDPGDRFSALFIHEGFDSALENTPAPDLPADGRGRCFPE